MNSDNSYYKINSKLIDNFAWQEIDSNYYEEQENLKLLDSLGENKYIVINKINEINEILNSYKFYDDMNLFSSQKEEYKYYSKICRYINIKQNNFNEALKRFWKYHLREYILNAIKGKDEADKAFNEIEESFLKDI